MELLIGSSGLFGSFYKKLHGDLNSIVCIDRLNSHQVFGRQESYQGTLDSIQSFLRKMSFNRVIYAAQYSDFRNTQGPSLEKMRQVNVVQPLALAEVICDMGIPGTFFSSGSVYAPKQSLLVESDPLRVPEECDPYTASRLAFEYGLQLKQQLNEVLLLRPFFMFGPQQRSTALFPRLIESVRLGREIFLNNEQGLVMNPIPVKRAVALLQELHNRSASGTYNLAGANTVSLKSVALSIGKALGKEVKFTYGNNQSPSCILGDIEKITKATGLDPELDFWPDLYEVASS